MSNLLLSFLLPVSSCDAPEAWQLYFQEAATPTMEGIINLHNDIMAIITFIAIQLGLPWQTSLAIALILCLSSTAIVLQTLTEKKLLLTEGGKSAIAVLLMQDVAVIPMLALLPLLALQEIQVDALLSAVLSGMEIIESKPNTSVIDHG